MRRIAVVAVVLIVLAGGIYGVTQLLSASKGSSAAVRRSVPSYHAMPAPAEKTTVTVDYATKPKTGKPPGKPATQFTPFTQCAAAGRSCGEVIQVTNDGPPQIEADPATAPYDGSAATLVGVVNDSAGIIGSLQITADTAVFAFAGDGACSGRFSFSRPAAGCPYGPTGYEGPGTSFTAIAGNGTAGTVTFAKPIRPGKTAWFSLAQALAATTVAGGAPSVTEQGGAPNPAEHQSACSQQPVNCATGTLWQEYTDLSVPGRGAALLLTRTYVSADANTPATFGYGWTDSYALRLEPGDNGTETVVQEDGSTVTFQPKGQNGGYTAPSRVLATLTDNKAYGTFTFFRYGSRVRYIFSAATGRLAAEADANGNVTQLTYNEDGTLQAVTDPEGRALTFQYTGGHVSQVTDPMGHTETYGYAGGQLAWASDDVGDTWHFGYQPGTNLLTTIKNPRGYPAQVTYAGERVASVTEPGRGTTDWSYSGDAAAPQGGTTAEQEPGEQGKPDGAVIIYDYRALELTAVTAGAGTADAGTTGYTYTTGTGGGAPAGLVAAQTDPELGVTGYAYDADGNLIAVTSPLHQTTRYAYQGTAARWGEVTRATMPGAGAPQESYQYDQQTGNLLQSTDGDGNVTTYAYGGLNDSDLLSVSGPNGQQARFRYDAYGDVTSQAVATETGGGTDTTEYAYDLDGHLTCQDAPAAVAAGVSCASAPWGTPANSPGTESISYNGAGEQVSVTSPAGAVTTTTYDPDGSVLTVTAPDGTVTRSSYNGADEETLQVSAGPGAAPVVAATFAYYADGEAKYQAVGPVSGDPQVTKDGYDLLGQLTSVTDPLGNVTRYAYGRDGELASVTDASSRVTDYAYNAAGQLTGVRYSDTATTGAGYAYYADGLPRSMTDAAGTTTYSYDGDGVLTAARTGAGGYSYKYDAATGTGLLTYPNGQQVTDTYDQAGQLVKVADWLGNVITFAYAPGGGLNEEAFPGDVQVSDDTAGASDDLEVRGNGTLLASFTDERATDGRLGSVATTGLPGEPAAVSYGYNAAGWLTTAGQDQLGYDPAGQLTTPSAGVTQQFNAAGELMPGGGARYGYDKEGDLVSATLPGSSPQALSYNQAGELTGYQSGPTTASYTYDGEGMLASEILNGVAAGFTWDLSGSSPRLLAAGPTSYVYGPDGQPVEQIAGSAATFLIADQQGNTRLLTSATGTVTGTYSYGPYGTPAYSCPSGTSSQGSCATTSLQYGGQYTDGASGDLFLGSRYYDPATGQYLTRPAPAANAAAPYAFAGDDPVNSTFAGAPGTPRAGLAAAEHTDQALIQEGGDPVTCLGLPGSGTTCPQFLASQLKQVDVDGLIGFIHDSISPAVVLLRPGRGGAYLAGGM